MGMIEKKQIFRNIKKILQIVLYISPAIVFSACGSSNPRKDALSSLGLSDGPYIQSEFQSYVDTFKSEAALRGVNIDTSNLTVTFGHLSQSNELGNCYPEYTFVEIDSDSWANKGTYEKEQILFHELGHCLLDRLNHRSDTVSYMGRQVSLSIMAPTSEVLYNKSSRVYYLNELFDTSKGADLTPDYIKTQNFMIKKLAFVTKVNSQKLSTPRLSFEDSTGKIQNTDLSQCKVNNITNRNRLPVSNPQEILTISAGLTIQFNQPGEYIVNFDCSGDIFSEAFVVQN